MKKYEIQQKFRNYENINTEDFTLKKMAMEIIDSMHIDDLKKVFNTVVLIGDLDNVKKAYQERNEEKLALLEGLMREDSTLFRCSITVKE